MRIEKTEKRERLWSDLRDATGKGHTSKALDTAARYYLRMRGDTNAVPTGQLEELLAAAEDRGSLTPAEIAEILDVDELPVKYETDRSIGPMSD